MEDENLLSIPGNCPEHGESSVVECNICGIEFCAECDPGTLVCSRCSTKKHEPNDGDLVDVDDASLEEIDDVLVDDFDEDDVDNSEDDLDDW